MELEERAGQRNHTIGDVLSGCFKRESAGGSVGFSH
jgi:hypothetical protein